MAWKEEKKFNHYNFNDEFLKLCEYLHITIPNDYSVTDDLENQIKAIELSDENEISFSFKPEIDNVDLELNLNLTTYKYAIGSGRRKRIQAHVGYAGISGFSITRNDGKYEASRDRGIHLCSPQSTVNIDSFSKDFNPNLCNSIFDIIKPMIDTNDISQAADFLHYLIAEVCDWPNFGYLDLFIRASKNYETVRNLKEETRNAIESLTKLFWNITMSNPNGSTDQLMCYDTLRDGRVIERPLVELIGLNSDRSYHISSPNRADSNFGFDVGFDENMQIISLRIGGKNYNHFLLQKHPFMLKISTGYYDMIFTKSDVKVLLKGDRKGEKFILQMNEAGKYSLINNIDVEDLLESFPEIFEAMKDLHLQTHVGSYTLINPFPIKDATAKDIWNRIFYSCFAQQDLINCVNELRGGFDKDSQEITLRLLASFNDGISKKYYTLRTNTHLIPQVKYINGIISENVLGKKKKVIMSYVNGIPMIKLCYNNPYEAQCTFQITREKDGWNVEFVNDEKNQKGLFNYVPSKLLSGEKLKNVLNYIFGVGKESEEGKDQGYIIFSKMIDLMPQGFRNTIYGITPIEIDETNKSKEKLTTVLGDYASFEDTEDGYIIRSSDKRKTKSEIIVGYNKLEITYNNNIVSISFFEDYPSIRIAYNNVRFRITLVGESYYYSSGNSYQTLSDLENNILLMGPDNYGRIPLDDGYEYVMQAINSPVTKDATILILSNILAYLRVEEGNVDVNELYQTLLDTSGISRKIDEITKKADPNLDSLEEHVLVGQQLGPMMPNDQVGGSK